jgi:O-acetyl-ADP-ribose deacetylase (regulator of RNase III)
MALQIVTGDATAPIGEGKKIIAHIVNNVGAWGKGFTRDLGRRFPAAAKTYLDTAQSRRIARPETPLLELGNVIVVATAEEDIGVMHMIAQNGLPSRDNPQPLDMVALGKCLLLVGQAARNWQRSVHMPKIGTGIARGKWSEIRPLIEEKLANVEVFIYELPP